MAFAGAGLATVTLSACYGAACTARVTLPDGTTDDAYVPYSNPLCGRDYDCRNALPDGGDTKNDSEWKRLCVKSGEQLDGGNKDGG